MKNARLTFQTESYDFYVGQSDKVWKEKMWVATNNGATIFNIVPKGLNSENIGGYFDPEYILKVKGYNQLSINEAFGI